MPTDSPRMIPVLRWAVAVVTEHADARAHTPQEARALEALQAAMDAASAEQEPPEQPRADQSEESRDRAKRARLGTDRIDSMRYALGFDVGAAIDRSVIAAFRAPRPTTIGAMLDNLRVDMGRLGVASLHAHPVGVDIVLRREG